MAPSGRLLSSRWSLDVELRVGVSRADGADEHVVGESVPPVASGAAAAGQSVMTVRPHLGPADTTMRAHERRTQAQPKRYAQFLVA